MLSTGIPQIDRYAPLVEPAVLDEIVGLAQTLAGTRVVHINTTAKGGGVVEILNALIDFFDGLGIQHDWQIVEIDPHAAPFMTKLIDTLQGGEPGEFSRQEQDAFDRTLADAAQHLRRAPGDVYIVHDLQLAPLARVLPELRPAIWFCHMDVLAPDRNAERYIAQYLDDYSLCAFNSAEAILQAVPGARRHVVTLGIDPFKPKNSELGRARGLKLIAKCGIDPERPLITQVSRYDRWKNPWQAVDIYRLVKRRIPTAQLAFVGAMEAADDSTAQEVFDDLRAYVGADPDVHLLHDPACIGETEVNAFQRHSTVVLQRSTREGFGLTVTEAMWKRQPVVGTSATGLRAQIIDGQTGYIVDATDESAQRVIELIQSPALHGRLGLRAQQHVQQHFLTPIMARAYLQALARVTSPRTLAVGA
jgi:trehalose synthase